MILLETNITFTKNGIKIINMDKLHTVLVHTVLEAPFFEEYECTKSKIIIGANLLHLLNLINPIDKNIYDTLTIYIEDKDYSEGLVSYLGIKFENNVTKQCKIQKLSLVEPYKEQKLSLVEPYKEQPEIENEK